MLIINWSFISGVMFGIEWIDELKGVVLDLGIIRLLCYYGAEEE